MKNGYPSRRKTYEHGAKMSEVYELSLDYEGGGYPEELLLHRAWMELSCQYTPLLNGPISSWTDQTSGILHIVRDP